jgi:osmoprotectant transport system ATP-binding protein
MIKVENVFKKYGEKWVVEDLNFEVKTGQTLVLLGTSGSGKTTTLKMINRLIEPSQGQIFLNEENILTQSAIELRRKIGYVVQSFGLFPHYTVAENIAVVPKLLAWPKNKIQHRVNELLSILNLPSQEFASKYPHQLSGGQKQRVAIARALAADPPVILMDEPFGALDPLTRAQVHQEFKNLENLFRKTIIIVSHDVTEAVYLGHQIALMHEGKVQQIGSPQDLIFKPENDFVRRFFQNQLFQLELQIVKLQDILPFLPSPFMPTRTSQVPQATHTLQEVLAQMAKNPDGSIHFPLENESHYQLNIEALLGAFSQFRNQARS